MPTARVHGGPDADGPAPHDFSANANACGPCPAALAAVQCADASRYPDPAYHALRAALGRLHGVGAERIVIAASASEFIMRITAAAARPGHAVQVPRHAYGDYAWAAGAHGLAVRHEVGDGLCLAWACDPSSPLGQGGGAGMPPAGVPLVLDAAYAPLRLHGDAARCDAAWQLWSPNKALGLTGVRGAYAVAPAGADAALVERIERLAPSWPAGAHGVAMLQAWADDAVQAWVRGCLPTLRAWKQRQAGLCESLGWQVLPSEAHFFCVRSDALASRLPALRAHGVQLRDCASFGLPGHLRLATLAPAHQDALAAAWAAVR